MARALAEVGADVALSGRSLEACEESAGAIAAATGRRVKAGVVSLTRVLALEWAGTGVTANAICPGPFATEVNRQLLDDPVKYQEFVRQILLGRWGELEELTGAAVFLASDARRTSPVVPCLWMEA